MNKEKKDFINVVKLSEAFNDFVEAVGAGKGTSSHELHLWQVRAQYAIAQQLTIIAAHLGKIVGKAEEGVRKNGSD